MKPTCCHCHERPATFWATYCDECASSPHSGPLTATSIERQVRVAYAEQIIRNHKRSQSA